MKVTIVSQNLNEEVVWESTSPNITKPTPEKPHWSNYILGILSQISELSSVGRGFNAVFGGDLPQGAGLSSSAALEVSSAYGKLYEISWKFL